jgi:ankyrin repeat protein
MSVEESFGECRLKRGADIQAMTDNGETPLAIARKAGHMELVEAREAISAKHAQKTKRLKVLRDRKPRGSSR